MTNILNTLKNTSKPDWIGMKYDTFVKNIVEPLNMMNNTTFSKIIKQLEFQQFEYLIQKCWEEQDKTPSQNPEEYEMAYEETLPIVLLLEKCLSTRIQIERDLDRKNKLAQQYSLVNLILSPHKLEGVANSINNKRK